MAYRPLLSQISDFIANQQTRADIMAVSSGKQLPADLEYVQYEHRLEGQYLPAIRSLISKDLSEPYSIYVYRYFLYQWSHLCFMVSRVCEASPTHAAADQTCIRPWTPKTIHSSASLSASLKFTHLTHPQPVVDTSPCWLWPHTSVGEGLPPLW